MRRINIRISAGILLILIIAICTVAYLKRHDDEQSNKSPQKQLTIKQMKEKEIILKTQNHLNQAYPYNQNQTAGRKTYFGVGRGYNLIMVQFESIQNFVVNSSIQGQEVTPVMNKLAAESLYFPYIFQQIGIGNTSDAEFISNTSIYPIGSNPMSSKFGNRKLSSMARLMKTKNYTTSTFHVNDVSYWDRDQLYPALGFDTYYDRPYFQQEKFNKFGASDEELYRVGVSKLKTLSTQRKKFYSQFVTVSSHSPFVIPKDRRRLQLPQKLSDSRLENYLVAINYADYALGTFIDGLKKEGLWDKSVFIVYGDHFGLHKKYHDPKEINEALGIPYHKQISTFNVPVIIHLPKQLSGKVINRTGGQVDILPTLANIMGIDLKSEGFTAFGHDLLNVGHNIVGMRYYLPTGSFFNDEILFVPGKEGFRDGAATSIKTLKSVKDITPYKFEYDYIMQWMKLSDRYVKQLPIRQDMKEMEPQKQTNPPLK
ncbi:LTA synthase family protein [Paenibacillus dokdonensis]|uniref:LTA synthase family protein n=1 Tax=Paenibacillus dokdonensis TaxID=2567944 RepID=UPI001FE63165|nr:LTA synthase family protein [Paenibacillus dokdonensis]